MLFISLKSLLRVEFKNSHIRPLKDFKTLHRCLSSNKGSCGKNPILMDPGCKTAVITGGTDGIGYATAHKLLCENAKKVALIGTNVKTGAEVVERLNCSFGKHKAIFFKCDVKNNCEVADTLEKIKSDLECIDIVVNAAGIWNDVEWHEEMNTNLGGTIGVNIASIGLVSKGNGVIVNLAALFGLEVFSASPPFASFASGITHFSRCLGHDENFKRFGIRIIALCTGITQTDLHVGIDQKMLTQKMGKTLCEYLKTACSQKPDACAKAVVDVIKYGPTGSVWVIEGSRLFSYDVPDCKKHFKLVAQYI